MKWQGRRKSDNVVDRRRIGGRGLAIGGGIGGVGGIIILVLYLLLGGNPSDITQSVQDQGSVSPAEGGQPLSDQDRQMGDFVAVVLADTEDVWDAQFQRMGEDYRRPHLVLFTGQVDSACGYSSAAVGPFYCPGDENVYLDLSFFEDMQRELDAPGDFALAYVIAHEVGHHVQNLLGISEQVTSQQARLSERDSNQLSVRLELQADFLAGVWAHYARQSTDFIDAADIEEGINAASAVGDDRIMKRQQGHVVPDAFTHGTSAQRVRWFKKGLESGDIRQGDTFAATRL
jgi:predicted metalloprotease